MLIHEATTAYLGLMRLDEAVTPPSEETLKKAIAGDSAALGDLYTRYHSEMMKVARARARGLDQAAIEDVVQDFFAEKILTGKLLKQFKGKPKDLIRFMVVAMSNAVRNANSDRARSALRHKTIDGAGDVAAKSSTSSPGATAKAVQAAFAKILKNYDANEASFVRALMVSPEGRVGGGKGNIAALAAKHAPRSVKDKSSWGTKAKKRFLKRFCADQGICRLLRGASPAAKKKAVAFCKGVRGSCVEMVEVFFALHPLLEAESRLTEDEMEQSVLNWIRTNYSED